LEQRDIISGLAALVASPNGRFIARGVASKGDGSAYTDLTILDVESGEETLVREEGCLAFMWAGDGLVTASVDTTQNLVRWTHVSLDGKEIDLGTLSPSRDLGFYLRFFEQYTQSHPLVDPEGKNLLLAGREKPGAKSSQKIYRIPLDGGPREELGEGVFAVYGPV
jgi:hypothetical protein